MITVVIVDVYNVMEAVLSYHLKRYRRRGCVCACEQDAGGLCCLGSYEACLEQLTTFSSL